MPGNIRFHRIACIYYLDCYHRCYLCLLRNGRVADDPWQEGDEGYIPGDVKALLHNPKKPHVH